jgi:hypothetical protein
LLVFAREQPTTHATDFAWVKRGIVWLREPRHERASRPAGGRYASGY